ncbi:magnesium-chelatase subunit H [Dinoroseobacter shibae DFL 12 = DSM 16493]|jgi:magnesium chelatase subunit H|uniref:magnesium chelatase n=1 Tax=Dinoroseobacter shibae (strain DSM 16493 / NCIMB 14021 / DFL 12) TaxID=398580 RepID=A8LQ29_DINSH|nr:magnesium chelatase subunit H [Dinoroseobacter shibae]ABV95269.1 magnesium-chelatase subunit H [Dinoroseobacter shibae DFL 12 = DSM 16493]URF46676.1 magnesium chelatase subunit H [Dinoroseobacter shibae]URF50982.1 magnesium chelatase subunit H [Dinoroseobacter shibae]
MLDNSTLPGTGLAPTPYRFVIITLDSHVLGPAARVNAALQKDFPGLQVSVHATGEWTENPAALEATKAAIAEADIVVVNLIFLDDQIQAILPALRARRAACDAMVCVIADQMLVNLTKMGDVDLSKPASGAMAILKKLKPKTKKTSSSEGQMKILRRLPKILRFLPGKAQDLRNYFLTMQYWLDGSDENTEEMLRMLISAYARRPGWSEVTAKPPIEYPEVGLFHPSHPARVFTDLAELPGTAKPVATIGLLMMRSYILSRDSAHYEAVIDAFEARGVRVIPAFAGGLDGRPAIERYFRDARGATVDAMVSLTGFSLVGGPAYNDSAAAVEVLEDLDIPYIAAHPLEFQTLGQWAAAAGGLGPVETTMLIALPEIDGATNPTVFAGRHGEDRCTGCQYRCQSPGNTKAMSPCLERIDVLAEKAVRLASLRRKENAAKKVAVVLFGFPPNAGAVGTAAYLSVFESLFNTLARMKAEGYEVEVPESVDALRAAVLQGNAKQYGQEANVAAHVSADHIVANTPPLAVIEDVWGPAPGKIQSDGRGVFILGQHFGNVFVGVQPTFGYEGDPMRLLFERGFAPTHAFTQFYMWLRNTYAADVVLHFGMHGALEFMPGKQAGLGARDWPDRLIGEMPNVYLYASNNPSEATLAKRRSNAVTVTHVTPPLATSGLYKGLAELKDSMARYRGLAPDADERAELAALIAQQAEAVDMDGSNPDTLWLKLLETEDALIPDGLHIVGRAPTEAEIEAHLDVMPDQSPETRARVADLLKQDGELQGLMKALSGRYVSPVPGGDLIRSPEVLPAGRNIHAFDPFRMPTAFAMQDGARQAEVLLETHDTLPRSIALVLWGSDNIKSDGGPIAQALALMGARPRFDGYGRLCGAELISLAELGRPRIDVIMTLSGIFRDLLPLQTKMLAEAAYLCAVADEPVEQNFVRAHALAYAAEMGCDMETAALRVFSNAEGAYGSNVNALVDSSSFGEEDELADAYEARKSFAYGRSGKASANPELLQKTLRDVDIAYQNLESVELGVTTVDHYFDTLGGIARAVKRAKGGQEAAVYIGDQTRGSAKVRTLKEQVALETRSRSLNPKWFESMLKHGHEGVRQIEAQVTNTMGWSATTGQVEPWVYQRLSETFVLDDEMRKRLADLNPQASARMANRLIEAFERDYWQPDADTLAALQDAADEIEDALEGITIAAE